MSKKKQETTPKYYSLDAILKENADYNIIIGERSNGKTFAVLLYALKRYCATGEQTAYVRRWREDIRGKRAECLFTNHVQTGYVSDLTGGKYNYIIYRSNRWYLANENEICDTPFCFAFALSEQEHEKSSSYPNITTIIFDEFLTRSYYLPDEFMLLMNILSTIIRQRNNVKIFMLGNTVNKFCPYFSEMGLKNIAVQKQGTIDVYKFGSEGATVAVEYTASMEKSKQSNKYFCFDNENLQMITGGKWEIAIYPHLPVKYQPKDVVFVFYIVFNDTTLQGNIIINDTSNFVYIHAKTTPIRDTDNNLIYSLECSNKPNYRRKIISTATEIEKKIAMYFVTEKVFYQTNEIGEIVRNYIKVSSTNNVLK